MTTIERKPAAIIAPMTWAAGLVLTGLLCVGCSPGGNFVEARSEADFNALVLKAPKPVMVEFYHDGCLMCVFEAPKLTAVSEKLADRANFVKVSVTLEELRTRYRVSLYPYVIVFNNSKEVDRTVARGHDEAYYEDMLAKAFPGGAKGASPPPK